MTQKTRVQSGLGGSNPLQPFPQEEVEWLYFSTELQSKWTPQHRVWLFFHSHSLSVLLLRLFSKIYFIPITCVHVCLCAEMYAWAQEPADLWWAAWCGCCELNSFSARPESGLQLQVISPGPPGDSSPASWFKLTYIFAKTQKKLRASRDGAKS